MTVSINIDPKDQIRIDNLFKAAPGLTQTVLRKSLSTVGTHIQKSIYREAPQGVTTKLSTRTKSIVSSRPGILEVEVFSEVPYARYVYYGRKPGSLPPATDPQFSRWVDRFVPGASPWAVAKNIERKGIEPNRFYDRALARSRPHINRTIRKDIRSLARRLDRGVIR